MEDSKLSFLEQASIAAMSALIIKGVIFNDAVGFAACEIAKNLDKYIELEKYERSKE